MSINAQPFQPQFKLIGNLAEDQVLVYDTSEGAFVNSTASGGSGASGYDAVANMGTGTALYFGDAGTTLQLKTIIGGTDITITDNGSGGLIVASTSTDTVQDGTNLGSGTGIFDSKDGTTHALKFKSLAVGAGLTLTDDGAGTLTLVNTNAAGTTDADLTLSNLSDNATARTNLGVYSKTESDSMYHKHDDAFVPSANNVHDIGSPTLKYNDIYAETFQGTAVLADQLTISGTSGQVLTHNGTEWVAGAGSSILSSASDVSNIAPGDGQHLVWNATTNLWTPSSAGAGGGGYQDSDARNAISVSGDLSYNATTGVISYTTPTDTDTTYTAGTGLTLVGTVFSNTAPDQTVALTGSGATTITGTYPNFTISSTDTDTNTTYTNVSEFTNDSGYLTSVPAQAWSTITGTPTTIAGYGITDAFDSSSAFPYSNLTGTPTIPTKVSDLTNDSGFISSVPAQSFASLTGKPTTLAGYGITDAFDGAFTSLSGVASAGASEDNMVLYYDHATTSFKWKTDASTPAGYNNANWDTAFGWGDHSTQGYLTSTTAHYTDSDVDTHLNVSGATNDQMLKWTGTDYAWVTSTDTDTTYTAGTNVTISGSNVISATDTNTTYVSSDFTHDDLTGYVPAEHIDWTTNQGATNIHVDNYINTTYSNLSEFSNDSGYITSVGVLSSHTDVHTSAPSNGDVLKWDAGNSRWAPQSDAVGSVTATSTTTFTNKSGNISQWTNDAGYLTSETDSQTLSLTGTTLAITGGNNVDLSALTIDDFADVNITSVADNQFLKYDNGSGEWRNETVTIPTLTSQLTNDAGFITSAGTYNNSDVDTHLNQSNPTSGFVLSWNGSDYAWVSNGAAGAHFDGQFSSLTGTPTTIAGYGITDAFDGAYGSLTGAPTLYTDADARAAISGTTGLSYNSTTGVMTLNASVGDLLNVSSTAPSSGQVLKWSGSEWAPAADTDTDTVYTTFNTDFDTRLATKTTADLSELTNKYFTDDRARQAISATGDISYNSTTGVISYTASHYTDSDVDTHLNKASAGTGEILSWNGSDYDWIANAGTPAWSAITGKPTTIAGFGITDAFDGAFASLSGKPTTIAGYGITDAFDGAYGSLTGAPTIPSGNQIIDWTQSGAGTIHASNYTDTVYANSDVDSHLNQSNPTSGYVLSWNGSDYAWVAQSGGGGGATDKIEEGDSSVEVIDGGANGHIMFETQNTNRWQITNQGHIHPETNDAFDIGSATKKVRDLYLGSNSLYIDTNTIHTSGTNLLFNDEDVMDYTNLKNKPTIPSQNTGGTGIQVNSGVVSLNANLSDLLNVHTTAPTDGQVLKWDNSNSRWEPGAAGGTLAMNDLTDVDTSGISTGQYLKWDGSNFVASTVSGGGASAIDDLSDVDTTTSAPNNGDVLTWVTADSEWAPAAPSGGGGGGASVQYFKLNYATNGNLTSITNATSGVSATILSATGGDVEVTFSGASYPPSSILIYGYSYGTNEYVIMPLNKDIGTRKISGGGTAGSPTAFGSFSAEELTLKLREADTGSSRSFGTTTHAWIMFTMV